MDPEVCLWYTVSAQGHHARALIESGNMGPSTGQLLGIKAGAAGGVEHPQSCDIAEQL